MLPLNISGFPKSTIVVATCINVYVEACVEAEEAGLTWELQGVQIEQRGAWI